MRISATFRQYSTLLPLFFLSLLLPLSSLSFSSFFFVLFLNNNVFAGVVHRKILPPPPPPWNAEVRSVYFSSSGVANTRPMKNRIVRFINVIPDCDECALTRDARSTGAQYLRYNSTIMEGKCIKAAGKYREIVTGRGADAVFL